LLKSKGTLKVVLVINVCPTAANKHQREKSDGKKACHVVAGLSCLRWRSEENPGWCMSQKVRSPLRQDKQKGCGMLELDSWNSSLQWRAAWNLRAWSFSGCWRLEFEAFDRLAENVSFLTFDAFRINVRP
jgi:hypothetical protein